MQMQFGAATAATYSSNLLAQSLVMSITTWQLTFDRLILTAVMIAHIARFGVRLGIRSASADLKDPKNFDLRSAWHEKLPRRTRIWKAFRQAALNFSAMINNSLIQCTSYSLYAIYTNYIYIYSCSPLVSLLVYCDNFHAAFNISLVALRCLMSSLADS